LLAEQIRAAVGSPSDLESSLDTLDDWADRLREVALESNGE
jgi:hypothetical protein